MSSIIPRCSHLFFNTTFNLPERAIEDIIIRKLAGRSSELIAYAICETYMALQSHFPCWEMKQVEANDVDAVFNTLKADGAYQYLYWEVLRQMHRDQFATHLAQLDQERDTRSVEHYIQGADYASLEPTPEPTWDPDALQNEFEALPPSIPWLTTEAMEREWSATSQAAAEADLMEFLNETSFGNATGSSQTPADLLSDDFLNSTISLNTTFPNGDLPLRLNGNPSNGHTTGSVNGLPNGVLMNRILTNRLTNEVLTNGHTNGVITNGCDGVSTTEERTNGLANGHLANVDFPNGLMNGVLTLGCDGVLTTAELTNGVANGVLPTGSRVVGSRTGEGKIQRSRDRK